jgi:hypothetical protein
VRKLRLEEAPNVSIRVIPRVEKEVNGDVPGTSGEEVGNVTLWAAGDEDAKWEDRTLGKDEKDVKNLILVIFGCPWDSLFCRFGMLCCYDFVQPIDDDNLWPGRFAFSVLKTPEGSKDKALSLFHQVLAEYIRLSFDGVEKVLLEWVERIAL